MMCSKTVRTVGVDLYPWLRDIAGGLGIKQKSLSGIRGRDLVGVWVQSPPETEASLSTLK